MSSELNGFLNINKPSGWTSHDVVSKVRRLLRPSKAGHGGTLDPMATGVLPLALGKATKVLGYLQGADKSYRAVMRLGVVTDTQDVTGTVIRETADMQVTQAQILETAQHFQGAISQIPPIYSAIKKDGVPLYKLARQGLEVERLPRDIIIHSLDITDYSPPLVTFDVTCSKGTYIRTLCHDMGATLGVGGTLESLVRTRTGMFSLEDAIRLDELEELAREGRVAEVLTPIIRALDGLCRVEVTPEGVGKIRHGVALAAESITAVHGDFEAGDRVAIVDTEGAVVAVASALAPFRDRLDAGRFLKPESVFV